VSSPPTDAPQASVPPTDNARRQLVVGAATLVGVYLSAFGPGVVTSIRALMGLAPPPVPAAWTDRVAALEWDVFTVGVVLIVVLRWLPRRAPLVTERMRLRRQQTRPIAGGLLGASAVYVAVAAMSSWVGGSVVSTWHLANGAYTQVGSGVGSFLVTGAAATAAGFAEEITLVALVAAVIEHVFDAGGRHARWEVPTTIAVLVALRLLVHLYYLWGSVFVLVWVPGAYLVYRWAGSVWPLVIGHWCYDFLAVAAQTFPGSSRQFDAVLHAVTAVGVAVVVITPARVSRLGTTKTYRTETITECRADSPSS
jgi:hypothetical protein